MDDLRNRIESALSSGYKLERELGGGGMSRTYLATESALGRKVVIKVLAPELLAGISVERFRREILTAAMLQHPHVVPVLTSGETDGIPWFTMPYVAGESLREAVSHGPLAIGEIVSLLRDVARALAYAHGHGIVHRDIKPDNVLVSAGSATVTDFGIAKAINAARTTEGVTGSTLTQAGMSIGTPAYMSPEQVLGEAVDHRTDIYSFGVMAWELLAGHAPFRADNSARLVALHLSEDPRDISEVRPDCPTPLARLVMQCLAKSAGDRPQAASELVRMLDSVTLERAAAVPQSGPEETRPARAMALWGLVTVGVSIVAWAATAAFGLPDWVLPGAVGLMLLGAPVLLLTAYVQRPLGRPSGTEPPTSGTAASRPAGTLATAALKVRPHLSWRRAWIGGAAAVGSFTLVVLGYMAMRALGIGPVGTLQARGEFGVRETLIVADFRGPAGDAELGSTVAEALRTDLGQSNMLTVLTRSALHELLALMNRPDEKVIHFDLAREIATREGAKAVLDGQVIQLGQGYVLSARLVSSMDGTELATFRREARNEAELLPELGRLSRAVRERAGESLREIRASGQLERVTTSSLPALRKYVEGYRAYIDDGNADRAVALLQEAVALDTAFAMAWRALGAALITSGKFENERRIQIASTAYRHRDRLTLPERLMTEAAYFVYGPEADYVRALEAYDRLLQLDSTNVAALNNAASLLSLRGDHVRAEEYYARAAASPLVTGTVFRNMIHEQVLNRRSQATLDSSLAEFRARFPDFLQLPVADMVVAWNTGRYDRVDSIARAEYAASPSSTVGLRAAWALGETASLRGQPDEAMRWYDIYSAAVYPVSSPLRELGAALDTAFYRGVLLGEIDAARGYVHRALERTPLEELSRGDRPWYTLLYTAAELQDSTLAKSLVPGYLRDVAYQEADSAGAHVRIMAMVAMASERWDEAIPLLHAARQAHMLRNGEHERLVGTAHFAAGRPDSAIVWLERFVATPDPEVSTRSAYLARVHRRLGELYEGRGDLHRAVSHYTAFIDLWRDAEPVFQPEVEEARRRVVSLQERSG